MIYSAENYKEMLKSLMPSGKALPRIFNLIIDRFWHAIGDELTLIDINSEALLTEAIASKSAVLIDKHEEDYDINNTSLSITERQEKLKALENARGGQRNNYFIDLAESLGYEIEIENFTPFWAGYGCAGDACGDQWLLFLWFVWVQVNGELQWDDVYSQNYVIYFDGISAYIYIPVLISDYDFKIETRVNWTAAMAVASSTFLISIWYELLVGYTSIQLIDTGSKFKINMSTSLGETIDLAENISYGKHDISIIVTPTTIITTVDTVQYSHANTFTMDFSEGYTYIGGIPDPGAFSIGEIDWFKLYIAGELKAAYSFNDQAFPLQDYSGNDNHAIAGDVSYTDYGIENNYQPLLNQYEYAQSQTRTMIEHITKFFMLRAAHGRPVFDWYGKGFDRGFSIGFDAYPSYDDSIYFQGFSNGFSNGFLSAHEYDGDYLTGGFDGGFSIGFDSHVGGGFDFDAFDSGFERPA